MTAWLPGYIPTLAERVAANNGLRAELVMSWRNVKAANLQPAPAPTRLDVLDGIDRWYQANQANWIVEVRLHGRSIDVCMVRRETGMTRGSIEFREPFLADEVFAKLDELTKCPVNRIAIMGRYKESS